MTEPKSMVAKLLQSKNAVSPIDVTDPKSIVAKLSQLKNAESPIDVTI